MSRPFFIESGLRDPRTAYAASIRDPMEMRVALALAYAGIEFEHDAESRGPRVHGARRLDFYLPAHGVHIEVKQFHSERIDDQMRAETNVIALQGEGAVNFFCEMIARRT